MRHRDRNPDSPIIYTLLYICLYSSVSLVVRTPVCGTGNPGSNPGRSSYILLYKKDMFIYHINTQLFSTTTLVYINRSFFICLWLPSSPAARKHIYIRNKVTYPYVYRYLCIFMLPNISLCNFTLALHHIIE